MSTKYDKPINDKFSVYIQTLHCHSVISVCSLNNCILHWKNKSLIGFYCICNCLYNTETSYNHSHCNVAGKITGVNEPKISGLTMIRNPSAAREMSTPNNEEQIVSSETLEADDSWSFFKYVRTKWNQMGGWRTPGLYDDLKAETGRNFNNNEPPDVSNNVNFRFSDGSTPLTRALKSHDLTAVEELLQTPNIDFEFPEKPVHGLGCVYNAPSSPPLIVAVKCGSIPLAKSLLDAGANVNCADGENYTPLYHSVDNGSREMTRLLLQYKPILECPHTCYDPIHIACKHGNFDIVKLLIEEGCSVDPDKAIGSFVSPLQNAIENSSEDICLYLLEHGADINNNGNCDMEPFLRVCNMGLSKLVDIGIQKVCDINITSKDGLTALMLSTKLYNYVSQRFLLFQVENVQCDIDSLTSGARELYRRRVSVVQKLSNSGCNLDTTCEINKDRVTALSLALRSYNLPVVVVLLKHGAKWDEMCQKLFLEMHKYLCRYDKINSAVLFILKNFIPKILLLLDHEHRMQFHRDANDKFAVPGLRDACRHVIRRRLKQFTESNVLESTSILTLIPSLNVPILLKNYLCYNEIYEEDYGNLTT